MNDNINTWKTRGPPFLINYLTMSCTLEQNVCCLAWVLATTTQAIDSKNKT